MFNIEVVHDKFEASLCEDDDVDLELYLESFEELSNVIHFRFLSLLGTIFSFVNKDLQQKMDHLNNLLKDNDTTHTYKTVKAMIEHEKESGLLYKTGFVSGSRTLLRIHRGLDFIQLFLKKIGELQDHDTTYVACREAYDLTLAKHHSFMIKNGAKMAMYTLPNRGQLLKRVCIEEEEIERALSLLPKTLEVSSIVYTRIDTLYTAHNLHDLP
ncbi:ceramide-1-phosphate transfer protein isoform X1 [Sitophilus oryzae]|uniref:Ceramide-1-phosphate transfer protein isoform X1 n=1 Tax=Sitophilus oryzae TaxID=7048 RepID=A0A6J2XHZ9_SITOR|nr:ceramide-1-phosphate transfer protein isoform X1 [Sitophilus oryzae]XP_030751072.1 ceramide-1-phosphate transfer protein isoform X1 [Sitophilus oryzae]XP_030751073.1 ceramide-1-phosphate transfer protein isoform X1 [Sitophilus oryzae]